MLNKNKKIIKKIENIETIENNFKKPNYIKEKFANKKFVKSDKHKKKYNLPSNKIKNDLYSKKFANY